MNQLSQNTAILFFSKTVEKESAEKALLRGKKNQDFLQILRKKSLQTVQSSQFPVFECSEQFQIGDTFGKRISNAFENVFAKGYDNVICVGSDCPELDLLDINHAAEALKESEIVLGPDFRGGLFLIGLNKAAFDVKRFESLKWNQPYLIDSFIGFGVRFNMHFLEAKFDLNFASELLHYAVVSSELQRLLKLVLVEKTPQTNLENFYYYNPASSEYLRGPPTEA